MDPIDRSGKVPRWQIVIALMILAVCGGGFLFWSLVAFFSDGIWKIFALLIGLAGLTFVGMLLRTLWIFATKGIRPMTFRVDEQGFQWGETDGEKKIPIAEVSGILWNEWDGGGSAIDFDFNLILLRHQGRPLHVSTAESLFNSEEDRALLLRYFRETFPHLPITGTINRYPKMIARRLSTS